MSKIEVNWEADLLPNKNLNVDGNQNFLVHPQRVTYGKYPIRNAVRNTVSRIVR